MKHTRSRQTIIPLLSFKQSYNTILSLLPSYSIITTNFACFCLFTLLGSFRMAFCGSGADPRKLPRKGDLQKKIVGCNTSQMSRLPPSSLRMCLHLRIGPNPACLVVMKDTFYHNM